MTQQRRTKYPPQLRRFVDAVEERARKAGHADRKASIYAAWCACFVRFCTTTDRSWQEAGHVAPFFAYLRRHQDVGSDTYRHAQEGLAFLFQRLLNQDVQRADWYPYGSDATPSGDGVATGSAAGPGDGAGDPGNGQEKGATTEQSTLLTMLLFHTSIPINEALDLHVGDVNLETGLIYVSDAMGTPKRIVEVPEALQEPLRTHVERLRKEEGPDAFNEPLFQANALRGRVDAQAPAAQQAQRSAPADSGPERSDGTSRASDDEDRRDQSAPKPLWGYTES
jgi:hypothetical protein